MTAADSLAGGPFWQAARWLSGHFELLGLGTVAAFLVAIALAVALAHRCTPSQPQIEAEEKEKLSRSLRDYVTRGEVIVRFE